jgi:hypothetical protein
MIIENADRCSRIESSRQFSASRAIGIWENPAWGPSQIYGGRRAPVRRARDSIEIGRAIRIVTKFQKEVQLEGVSKSTQIKNI